MNDTKIKLIDEINKTITNKPLIFFSREAERAMGLEREFKNFHICCIENSYIVERLIKDGVSVFCLEKELGEVLASKSTNDLLKNTKTQDWVRRISNGDFYGITFKPQSSVKYHIESQGGTYLGNDIELTQKLENKITIDTIFKDIGVNMPNTIIKEVVEETYSSVSNKIGSSKFFFQLERGHTGNSTFLVSDEESFKEAQRLVGANQVKISEYIKGVPTTLNLNIDRAGKTFIGPMQVQITGIPGTEGTEGVTVGNDFSAGTEIVKKLNDDDLGGFIKDISVLSKKLVSEGYLGLIGLDLILKDGDFYFIELNARQSANIPFETQLILGQKDHEPLLLLHYATMLSIDLEPETYSNYRHLASIEGSQVFFRSTKNEYEVRNNFKSGIYRLQGDNSAKDWKGNPEVKENVIFLDEDADKPLVFNSEGIYLNEIEGGFILNVAKEGAIFSKLDEVGRVQLSSTALIRNKLKPWIKELYKVFFT